jgi:hypothetical protein
MIEVFVLIGWIHGYSSSGGVVNQEFNSFASCEAAKTLYVEMHEIDSKEDRSRFHSWVECVKK